MFANAIKDLRKQMHLSQQAFAKELGVSYATINRWENQKQEPSSLAIHMVRDYCRRNKLEFPMEPRENDE